MLLPCPIQPLLRVFPSYLSFLLRLEGESAASADEPASSNPYESGTLKGKLWMVGWMVYRSWKPYLPAQVHSITALDYD